MKLGHFLLNQFVRKKVRQTILLLLFCEISDALVFLENMEGHGGLGRQVSRIDLQVWPSLTIMTNEITNIMIVKKSEYPWNSESEGNCFNQEGDLYSLHYDQRKELGRGKFGVVYHVKVCPFVWRFSFVVSLAFYYSRTNRPTDAMQQSTSELGNQSKKKRLSTHVKNSLKKERKMN